MTAMRPYPRYALRAVIAAALLPALAVAEEPGDLGTVWVVGRVLQPLVETAASVSALDDSAPGQSLARDLRDAIRYTPGVSLPSDPVRFGADTISIRGVGGNRVLLETDGVPSPSGFAIGNFSNFGRAFSDLALVSRTEIMRGPASALYGSDAIGGVVSTRTLTPSEMLASADRSGRLQATYYSADRSWLTAAAGALRDTAGLEAMVAYARRTGAELDNGTATLAPNPRADERDTLLARVVLAAMDHPLGLTLSRERSRASTDVQSDVLQPGRFANTTAMDGDDHADTTRVILQQELLPSGFEQGMWRAFWQQSGASEGTHETRRAAPPAAPLDIQRAFTYDERTLGAEGTLARRVDGPMLRQRLVFGAEVERHAIEERRDGRQTNLTTGATTNVILGEVLPLRDFPNSTETRAGAYLQDELRSRAGRTTWIPAVRLDYYHLAPSPDPVYSQGNPGQSPVSMSRLAASPRLGATWETIAHLTLFAQYTHGYRAPPFSDVNIGLYLPQFNVRAIPNPDLKPEVSDGVEFGLRSSAPAASGSVSAFYTRYRDFIASKVNLGVDPATGATLFQSINLTRTEIWGIEAEGRIRPGEWRAALAPLGLRYALSYARGEDTGRHRPLNSIDPAKAVVGFAFAPGPGTWSVECVATAVARKTRVDDTPATLVRTGGYVTFDLLARWQPSRHITVDAGVMNLFDRSYTEWTDVSNRLASDPTLPLYQRPGRNLSISVSYRP